MTTKYTCGNCRYFVEVDDTSNKCTVNPPVIVDALAQDWIKNVTKHGGDYDPGCLVMFASRQPDVDAGYNSCRFFEEVEEAPDVSGMFGPTGGAV